MAGSVKWIDGKALVLVSDVVGAVVVHAIEVVGTLHELAFLFSELGEAVAELLDHRCGVVAEVDRVSKPRDGKFDLAVTGYPVLFIVGVPRLSPVTCNDVRLEVLESHDNTYHSE